MSKIIDVVTCRNSEETSCLRRCFECGDLIIKDEIVEYTLLQDAITKNIITCLPCVEVRNKLLTEFTFGEVWNTIYEMFLDKTLLEMIESKKEFSDESRMKFKKMVWSRII